MNEVRVTFWAQLSRPDPEPDRTKRNVHGETLTSKPFGTQSELVGWVRSRREHFTEVATWRRESSDGGYKDFPLQSYDDEPRDVPKMRALIASLKVMLDAKKRELDRQRTAARPRVPVNDLPTYADLYEPGEPVSSTERPPASVLPPSEPEQGAWDVDGPETA